MNGEWEETIYSICQADKTWWTDNPLPSCECKKFLHSSYMLQSFYKTIHKQDQLSNNQTMNIDRCKDSQKRLNGYQITHDHDQSTATLGHNSVSDHNFGIILNIL